MRHPSLSLAFLAIVVPLCAARAESAGGEEERDYTPLEAPEQRPRLMVLTDIGGDPDDQQSMIRLMLYANEFDIEGLIASASGTPGELREKTTRPELIRRIIDAYGGVQHNLARHASGYPDAAELLACVKSGNPNRGESAVGEGRDTEGSRWILSVVDREDPRPVNVAIWGGQTDLAQALWRVRRDRGAAGLGKFIEKIRVHDIADQDGIAEFIWREFPGLFYILDRSPHDRDKREAVFRGMYLGGDLALTSRSWIDAHVRHGHGPLGALYPAKTWTAPNPHAALKEGDTPSWFYFRAFGLSDSQHPEWGGWGGRFERKEARIYRDAADEVNGVTSARATVWRWRNAFQNDFQARMDWCVLSPHEANHQPVAVCNGVTGDAIVRLAAQAGQHVILDATGSDDPDGDDLRFRWWLYPEPSNYRGAVAIAVADEARASVHLPRDGAGQTLHVVQEVLDDGDPPLTDYRRVVIEIGPQP